jgi:DNA invertase Pin-like site-specific DNA recombinase
VRISLHLIVFDKNDFTMTTYGYARTPTISQVAGLTDQVAKLKAAGCTNQTIYQEQISSVKMADRVEFAKVLSKLKKNDVLVFTSLSRVARSMIHMIEIESAVAAAGASIQILDMAVDTSTPQGRLTFNLFGSIANLNVKTCLNARR